MAGSTAHKKSGDLLPSDQPEGLQLVDGEDDGSWDQDLGIHERIFRASRDVATLDEDLDVRQKGTTKAGKDYDFTYKGISHHQTTLIAKVALSKYGVKFSPQMEKDSLRIEGNKTLIWVEGRFINVDAPGDEHTSGSWGEATDNKGQGVQKAFTNAVKSILQKELNMTTKEEEITEDITHVPEGDGNNNKVSVEAWASTYKSALESCGSMKDYKALVRDNKQMLNSDAVSDVTKRYFEDMQMEIRDYIESKEQQES